MLKQFAVTVIHHRSTLKESLQNNAVYVINQLLLTDIH